jgi:hypothetical protein
VRRIIPKSGPEDTGIIKIYDLRDPDSWEQAGRERDAWGRQWAQIHRLDNDHVIIEFKPGVLEASA